MPPKGYAVPEGTSTGETFQELCTFRLEKNGVCLTKMGDVECEADKGGSNAKPDYSNYVNSMQQPTTEQES